MAKPRIWLKVPKLFLVSAIQWSSLHQHTWGCCLMLQFSERWSAKEEGDVKLLRPALTWCCLPELILGRTNCRWLISILKKKVNFGWTFSRNLLYFTSGHYIFSVRKRTYPALPAERTLNTSHFNRCIEFYYLEIKFVLNRIWNCCRESAQVYWNNSLLGNKIQICTEIWLILFTGISSDICTHISIYVSIKIPMHMHTHVCITKVKQFCTETRNNYNGNISEEKAVWSSC